MALYAGPLNRIQPVGRPDRRTRLRSQREFKIVVLFRWPRVVPAAGGSVRRVATRRGDRGAPVPKGSEAEVSVPCPDARQPRQHCAQCSHPTSVPLNVQADTSQSARLAKSAAAAHSHRPYDAARGAASSRSGYGRNGGLLCQRPVHGAAGPRSIGRSCAAWDQRASVRVPRARETQGIR
jgi:hypothetical protein